MNPLKTSVDGPDILAQSVKAGTAAKQRLLPPFSGKPRRGIAGHFLKINFLVKLFGTKLLN